MMTTKIEKYRKMEEDYVFGKDHYDSISIGTIFVWEKADGERVLLKKIGRMTQNYKSAAGEDKNGVIKYVPFYRVRTVKPLEYLFSKFKNLTLTTTLKNVTIKAQRR